MINDKDFIKIVESSKTMAKAATKLNLHFNTFKKKAIRLGVYKPNQGSKGIKKGFYNNRILTEDIISGKYPEYQTYKLKIRLIDEGYFEDKCQLCGWDKKPDGAKYTPCELHHKDGNPHNHLLSNLELTCPNCHSLTKNYRFRTRAHE